MTLPQAWTLISFAALVVWLAVATDSISFWRRFRRADASLASAYFREVIGDATMLLLGAFCSLVGVLASVRHDGFDIIDVLVIVALFSIPTALLLLGLYRYWRRRQTRP